MDTLYSYVRNIIPSFVMAASSSDESGTTPRDFHLSSSLESESRLDIQKFKCPLCFIARRKFYCRKCIEEGDFYISKAQPTDKSYRERQIEFNELCLKDNEKQDAFNGLSEDVMKEYDLKSELRTYKERVRSLEIILKEKRELINYYKKELSNLITNNKKKADFQDKCDTKIQEIEEYVENEEGKLLCIVHDLQLKKTDVKKFIRTRSRELSQYIFPIFKTQPRVDSEQTASELVMALEEASQSLDLRGSWEYTENCSEMNFAIVAPSLPASGNYTCYNMWLAEVKESSSLPGSTTNTEHENHANSISAALTYTTQFVNILAQHRNAILPFKVSPSEFCVRYLTEQQFNTRVARLNANIFHLCYTGNVNLERLIPGGTIHNLLQLLETCSENEPDEEADKEEESIDVENNKVDNLEKPIMTDLQKGDDSDSEDGLSGWEALPNIQYPEVQAGPVTVQTSQVINNQQASSMAGGLVNSAAASIASIWKGFTGR
ncbi:beclin 1-associated autophagy-related key regulator isoform X2 [Harmonia axyridis]|uniref:beclin 1-associated autophagy-related key regulator isoform X2 n=1 Tax=Harmonia axyridis TaxID=115357 RepID=UPI001E276619|nr:beclin 1-associated autophagy-related key regulator isoform X2 [Harmonia axyridis]